MKSTSRGSTPSIVLFDLDGTLVDTQWADTGALLDFAEELDPKAAREVDAARFRTLTSGLKLAEAIAVLCDHVGSAVPERAYAWVRARAEELLGDTIEPIPRVRDALDQIPLPKVIVSNSPSAMITSRLERAGLIDHFDRPFVSAYDFGLWKPSPDLYLRALSVFGVAASECIAVEDSLAGVSASVGAGIQTLWYAQHGESIEADISGSLRFSDMEMLPRLIFDVTAPYADVDARPAGSRG